MAKKERGTVLLNATYSSGAATVSNGRVYIPLPTTNTVYCDPVYVGDSDNLYMGMAAILNGVLSSSNAIVTVEQSWALPAVNGSYDATYVAVQTLGMTAVSTWNYVALLSASNAALMPYIRCKVVSATTSTSSTVNIIITKQVAG